MVNSTVCTESVVVTKVCMVPGRCYVGQAQNTIHWNLSNVDTIGTKIFVLISEVFLFQQDNSTKLRLSQVS